MRNEKSEAKDPNTLFPVQLEVFHCPACDGVIPEHHRFSDVRFSIQGNTRHVTVYCEHCNAAWTRWFTLDGAAWRPTSDVSRVVANGELSRVMKKVHANNNDRAAALPA